MFKQIHTQKLYITIVLCLLLFTHCKESYTPKYPTHKLSPNDPFTATIVESEFFEIDTEEDNVIEGKNGTIVVIPKGALLHKDGSIAKGKVKIELAEALAFEEMLLSNLTTTSDGKLLQSGGMVYINATDNEKALHIDSTKPLYIEIPTQNKLTGMMAYRGIRDTAGNMIWKNPKPLENYLTPIPLRELDFLPEGFSDSVKVGMPYRGYVTASKRLVDSLYYSLSANNRRTPHSQELENIQLNEAEHNSNKKIEKGKYTDESFEIKPKQLNSIVPDTTHSQDTTCNCGINPASIKVIKSEKFNTSFIATREFETRMRHIHRTCSQNILDLYINNIDKQLWQADLKAYELLKTINHFEAENFKNFYEQKLGTVKANNFYTSQLAKYYNEQLKKTEAQLLDLRNQEVKKHNIANQEIRKVKEKYRDVLWKREKYRNEKYGFVWTELGWINVDIGVIPKNCPVEKVLEVTLKDSRKFDRVYIYVSMPSIKSIYRLNSMDNVLFYAGNITKKTMNFPCENLNLLAIGYVNEQAYFASSLLFTKQENFVDFSQTLIPLSNKALKDTLKKFDSKTNLENQINVDLKFQDIFYKEEKRQKTIREEALFIEKLSLFQNKCCCITPTTPILQ